MVTLYHGTRLANLEAIRREGLRPGALRLVWATEDREAAAEFAANLDYPQPNPEAVVVELRVPKGSFIWERPIGGGRVQVPGTRVARFAGGVRPEWVVVP